MEQNIVVRGAGGLNPAPVILHIHDNQYDLEVYLASFPNPLMDILVPTHGHLELTIKCIQSLYMYTQTPFHLIILDDSPPEDLGMTAIYVHEQQKEKTNITYIHSNIHWKTGNTFFNAGLKYCKTAYVVTCMNSMTVEPVWEIVALDLMRKDPLVGTVGFKCLFPNGLIESAGIAFVGHLPTDMGRDEPGYRVNEIREAQAVQWAFAMHRKKAIEGNLDEEVFNGHVGWDDIDNCLVVKSKGWKILYCGLGCGIHQPRATRGSNSIEASKLNWQNAHRFFKRWDLWNTYIGGLHMDVKDLLKYETKDKLTFAVMELQVLDKLLKQAQVNVQALVNQGLTELGLAADQYVLEMNPGTNIWLAKPNPNSLLNKVSVPVLQPIQVAKPSSDTESNKVESAVA